MLTILLMQTTASQISTGRFSPLFSRRVRAYEILSDDFKRKEYDDTSSDSAQQQAQGRTHNQQWQQQQYQSRSRTYAHSRHEEASAEEDFKTAFEEIDELFRRRQKHRKERVAKVAGDVHLSTTS